MSIHHDHYVERNDDPSAVAGAAGIGGAIIGIFLIAMLVIGFLLALFVWSPWYARVNSNGNITPQTGTQQPSGDTKIDIRGDIRVLPQNPSSDQGTQPSNP